MRRKSHVRFGERDGENRIEQSMYGVSVPTLRRVEASPEDVLVTREAVEAGRLLDIELTDHLIVSQGCWLSMRQRGLGFNS